MPHKHTNDMPGDIAGEQVNDLPGGFGGDDPDANIDAVVDELFGNDAGDHLGNRFTATDTHGGITSGTGYTDAMSDDMTVDPADLLEEG